MKLGGIFSEEGVFPTVNLMHIVPNMAALEGESDFLMRKEIGMEFVLCFK